MINFFTRQFLDNFWKSAENVLANLKGCNLYLNFHPIEKIIIICPCGLYIICKILGVMKQNFQLCFI